jgi:tetratricopeptide (TPR) repeat protein
MTRPLGGLTSREGIDVDGQNALALEPAFASSVETAAMLPHMLDVENGDTALTLMRQLTEAGRLAEAAQCLAKVRQFYSDLHVVLDDIQALADLTLRQYQAHLAVGELSQAANCLDILVQIAPGSPEFLQEAFALSQTLEDTQNSVLYAKHLLLLDPTHYDALEVMVRFCEQSGNTRGEAEYRLRLAGLNGQRQHSVAQLYNICEGLNATLLNPLDDHTADLVEQFLAAARAVPDSAEARSELYLGWEKHYRLTIEAIDVSPLAEPTTILQPYPPILFMASTGRMMSGAEDLRSAAAQVGAKVVFFVAADEAYVQLYAKLYISSVLKNSHVPCLVIVHLIGGADRVGAMATEIGITDDRLIYSADGFDPKRANGRCYRPPPTGWCGLAAYYQSARFQWLGYFLEQLNLPMFVSDIDLLLQREVGDLLARCAAADVTFNENSDSRSYSSRLTANLILVQPTAIAKRFADVLGHYLTRALQKDAIHYMIDQCAVLMARHIVARETSPRYGYFDTSVDINNLIYPDFRENPFRFLSLYHGFDLSTLDA